MKTDKTPSNKKVSIRELAKKTGSDRASISKWIGRERDEKKCLDIIFERQRREQPKLAAVDPSNGLTWFQSKLREDTIRLRRENEEAAAIQADKWISAEEHHKIIALVISRLEGIPGRAHSELGLTDVQTAGLRRALDEAREAAAKDIEAMR